jgi:hypothetical protein
MCLPVKSEKSSSRSIVGLGALMVLACLAGPVIAGALGAIAALAL